MENEKTILVAGSCQIGGLAAAMQRIHPDHQVLPLPLNPRSLARNNHTVNDWMAKWLPLNKKSSTRNNSPDVLKHRLTQADFVIGNRFVKEYMVENAIPTGHYIPAPGILFKAFHPDIISVRARSSKAKVPGAYHSAICLWSYKNGLDPEAASRLFNKRVFRALGYFDQWDPSVRQLKTVFDQYDLDFGKFMSAVKREGIFMHTPNHPRIPALIWLAKMVSRRTGADDSVWRKEILINDGLAQVESWPVYPEIASEYALHGSYDWFLDHSHLVSGIRSFVDHFYNLYAETGVPASDIQMLGINENKLGSLLSSGIRGQL